MIIKSKIEKIENILKKHSPFVLLFSGGVDSGLLATIAREASIPLEAIFFSGNHLTLYEIKRAHLIARGKGIPLTEISIDLLQLPEAANNHPARCYACKKKLICLVKEKIKGKKVLDGSHIGDLKGFRPGRRALEEEGVISPWIEAGYDKKQILELAISLNFPIHPPRSCLLTRFPYNFTISRELLLQLREMEDIIFSFGIKDFRIRRLPEEFVLQIGEKDAVTFKTIKEKLLYLFRESGIQEKISWVLTQHLSGFFDK